MSVTCQLLSCGGNGCLYFICHFLAVLTKAKNCEVSSYMYGIGKFKANDEPTNLSITRVRCALLAAGKNANLT